MIVSMKKTGMAQSQAALQQRLSQRAVGCIASAGVVIFMGSQASISEISQGILTGIGLVIAGFGVYFLVLLRNKKRFAAFYRKHDRELKTSDNVGNRDGNKNSRT